MHGFGLALGAVLVGGALEAGAGPVEVEVGGLGVDTITGSPVVRLLEKRPGDGAARRELPIWIGPAEAQAIVLQLQALPPPRPLPHDLMQHLIDRLGARLRRVVIESLRDGTYYATLHVEAPGARALTIDARPSDAIALALRCRAGIEVEEALFRESPVRAVPMGGQVWGLTVQDLTPEVAGFFSVEGTEGVLVADVAAAGAGTVVARGDVITAVDGEPVRSVAELRARAATRSGATSVRLSVRRDGRPLALDIAPGAARAE